MTTTLARAGAARAALALVSMLAGLAMLAVPPRAASAGGIDPALTDSAVTVSGTGEFADLKVTVSQTKDLINQVLKVSWTGGTPTTPSVGHFAADYLQLMQCWGDPATGPSREQCQFGGFAAVGDTRGGNWVTLRQVNYAGVVDPLETYLPAGPNTIASVPFAPAKGASVTGSLNEYFDAYSTNEIPFGRTRADGTGEEYFEAQTAREAQGLGCGDTSISSDGKHACWLVVVPRGDKEVNGTPASVGDPLVSSPLSASNWAHHIAVPLAFLPVTSACPIGAVEQRTVGQENVAEAIARWQPTLCADGGATYGYSQVPDVVARRQLGSTEPGLVFTSSPIAADDVQPDRPPIYAPVALSGITIAFLVERQTGLLEKPEVKLHDGMRVADLNLTPLLVAKLLTQSYRNVVLVASDAMAKNPIDLSRDPDFLAVNPDFAALNYSGYVGDILLPVGLSDSTTQLWGWVNADPQARAFLDGEPDGFGMVVNPSFKGLELPTDDFPKNDPSCRKISAPGNPPDLCTLDAHPYAGDMHEAARAASRGDALSRSVWDPNKVPPAYTKAVPQLSGTRTMLALTDTATAARYGLQTARLRNSAGQFVAPSEDSMLAAQATMTPSEDDSDVLVPNVTSAASGAYPLTVLTYAATAPAAITQAAGADYAAMLRYAAGTGQRPGVHPGELPEGYAPLPARLRNQTLTAATTIEAMAGQPVTENPVLALPAQDADQTGSDDSADPDGWPESGPTPGASSGSSGGSASTTVPDATAPPLQVPPPVPSSPIAHSLPTVAAPVGAVRYAMALALLVGGPAALAGPTLLRRATKGR